MRLSIGGGRLHLFVDSLAMVCVLLAATPSVALASSSTFQVSRTSLGEIPVGMTTDPTTHTAYVVDALTFHVQVIDELTMQVTGTIALVPAKPLETLYGGVAVDPVLHTLYVGTDDGTIFVINTKTQQVVTTFAVFNVSPITNITVDPATGLAFVSSGSGGEVCVVDLATLSIVKNIVVGSYSSDVALNPDLHRIYALATSGTVTVIDESTLAVIQTIQVNEDGRDLALDESADSLCIDYGVAMEVQCIDLSSDAVTATISTSEYVFGAMIDDPAEDALFVANYNGSISVIDTATQSLATTLNNGSGTTQATAGGAYDSGLDLVMFTDAVDNSLVFISSVPPAETPEVGSVVLLPVVAALIVLTAVRRQRGYRRSGE